MKATHKKIIGNSKKGIKCHCCRVGSVKDSRVLLNRMTRRAFKISLAIAGE